MPLEKLTVEDLRNRINNEGIGYAVQSYYGRNIDCEDETATKLWAAAYDALTELEKYVESNIEEDEEDNFPVDWNKDEEE